MAPRKRPWLRLYVEIIWDRKIRKLPPAHRWLWVTILALARDSALPGFLLINDRQPMDEEDIADAAALKLADVRTGLNALTHLGLIHMDPNIRAWTVVNWKERQYESDDVTKRTSKHRTKERSIDGDSSPDVTPPEDRVQKTENRSTPLPPASGGASKNPRANGTNPRAVAKREKQQEAKERQDRIDACEACDENGLIWWPDKNEAERCTHSVGVNA